MILIAGLLLVAVLGVFLTIGRWRSPFNRRDLPKKLGVDIRQEANGFTHAEFHAGHALFKITASKVEQLKDDRYRLHAVKIEMYSPNGGGTDRIEGADFEYDQQAGIAKAAGPVEITLDQAPSTQQIAGKSPKNPARPALEQSQLRQIHVKTVGLTFNQNSGVASSANHVEFDLAQTSGSAQGASYDSQRGMLVLAGAVELNAQRGQNPVKIQAQHAEFERDSGQCDLADATANYRQAIAHATEARILFRDNGSARQLDAAKGLVLTTVNGARVAAPTGSLHFNQDSQPMAGSLDGGVVLDDDQNGRVLHGTAPKANLRFSSNGLLQAVQLERGVDLASDELEAKAGLEQRSHRTWKSPVADLRFRTAGAGRIELATIHGSGGVIVTTESQRDKSAPAHARMAADDMTGEFGANSALTSMTGSGHAILEQTAETGMRQTTRGDRVEVQFAAEPANWAGRPPHLPGTQQIEEAIVAGHVLLMQQPAVQPGAKAPAALRATAQRADYEGAGEWLHLTGAPHVENGEIALDAEKVDLARVSGDAFAHGAVKATWFGSQGASLGAQGPAHIVASEAQLNQASGVATFRGDVRLWQQANSISAPFLVLDRARQTLTAQTTNQADPVRAVLVSAGNFDQSKPGKGNSPSVIRVRGGDLKYSEAERKAVMRRGVLGSVVAETAEATSRSQEVDLLLMPPANHAGKDGGSAQVDHLTARGNVSIESQGRHGTGEMLDYSSERAEYVLTGTAANPPRLTDPTRGTVTGESLIFNSRDDSVNVEGGQRATTTETTAPKRP